MKNVTIEEISHIVTKGTTPTTIGAEFANSGIPFIKAENIIDGTVKIDSSTLYINHRTDVILARSRIQPGDVLITIAGTIGRTALVPANSPMLNCNQAVAIIRPKDVVDPNYLKYCFQSTEIQNKIYGLKVTATISNLSLSQIRSLQIPLPPLSEQKKIAAVLDKADQLRQKRKEAIDKLDKLVQAVFLDMFGDPVTNPKGWEVKSLEEVISIDAKLVDPRDDNYKSLYHIGGEKIESRTGNILPLNTAEEDTQISSKYLFNDEDILYSKIRPYLRKVTIPGFTGLCSSDIYPIRPVKGILTPDYLMYILLSDDFTKYADTQSSRTNIPKINREQLNNYNIMLPTYKEQLKYKSFIQQVNIVKRSLNTDLTKCNSLFNSLLQRAFKGELKFNDKAFRDIE